LKTSTLTVTRPSVASKPIRRREAARADTTAVVNQTRPCATDGDDQPRPGT
jgi:hypothetical protein